MNEWERFVAKLKKMFDTKVYSKKKGITLVSVIVSFALFMIILLALSQSISMAVKLIDKSNSILDYNNDLADRYYTDKETVSTDGSDDVTIEIVEKKPQDGDVTVWTDKGAYVGRTKQNEEFSKSLYYFIIPETNAGN